MMYTPVRGQRIVQDESSLVLSKKNYITSGNIQFKTINFAAYCIKGIEARRS